MGTAVRRSWNWVLAVLLLQILGASGLAATRIELDLRSQRAFLVEDGQIVLESPISSGRASRPTPRGRFRVLEKDLDHRSSLYGKIVAADGRVLKADADDDTPVPPGARFVQAPMRYFLRFKGAYGMHAGHLPGYPASHGCVRLPASRAAEFYHNVDVGTEVVIR